MRWDSNPRTKKDEILSHARLTTSLPMPILYIIDVFKLFYKFYLQLKDEYILIYYICHY